MASSVPSKKTEAKFRFLGAEHDEELAGTVLIRGNEKVLDIPDGDGPYLIVGKAYGHGFRGTNSAGDEANRVDAKWADLEGICVGQWIEEGDEYLFSFTLPRAAR